MTLGICDFAEQIKGVQTQSAGFRARVGFVDHVAEGWMGTMRNPNFWNGAGVSAHFCIGKDGSLIQLVNIFDTAFHAGRLGPISWPHYQTMQKETGVGNPNSWFVGVEHEGFTGEPWTPAMYATNLRLKRWCIEEAKVKSLDMLRFGIDSLTGHFMFDGRDRKNCPGSGWPREQLFADLTGGNEMPDGWKKEGEFHILYNGEVPVFRIGGALPGRISKLFGDKWLWLRLGGNLVLPQGGSMTMAYWSEEEGD